MVVGSALDAQDDWSERELKKLARSVLEVLVYLQSFSPPLFHRDIKPENLIRSEEGYSLVDFGSIRLIGSQGAGSTITGTSGYLAPEQLMGRASKSSDLYGLGMTLIHLFSGKHPADLERKSLCVQWSDYHSRASERFVEFVNLLTSPHAEDRFPDAQSALVFLDEKEGPTTDLLREPEAVEFWTSEDKTIVRFVARSTRYEEKKGRKHEADRFIALLIVAMILLLAGSYGFTSWQFLGTGVLIFGSYLWYFFNIVDRTISSASFTFGEEGMELGAVLADSGRVSTRLFSHEDIVGQGIAYHKKKHSFRIGRFHMEMKKSEYRQLKKELQTRSEHFLNLLSGVDRFAEMADITTELEFEYAPEVILVEDVTEQR